MVKTAKTNKGDSIKEAVKTQVKPSYEELEKFCTQLSAQNRFFREQLNKAFDENLHKIMGHLFKVVTINKENPNRFNSQFVEDVFSKIEEMLTPFLEKEISGDTTEDTENK